MISLFDLPVQNMFGVVPFGVNSLISANFLFCFCMLRDMYAWVILGVVELKLYRFELMDSVIAIRFCTAD